MTAIPDSPTNHQIRQVLETENIAPSANVRAMCEKIQSRHAGRVQGFLYYGSSLRAMNDPDKMLDFYVLVDSYRKTHKNPVRAFWNWLMPPTVYYLENTNDDNSVSSCKYSIISLNSFEKKCTARALLSVVWGRFSQPCVLLFATSEAVHTRIQSARIQAIRHMFHETAPLCPSPVDAVSFWAEGFNQSYRTELRPESAEGRSREIVERYEPRYREILAALATPDDQGLFILPPKAMRGRTLTRLRWFLRRLIGKPAAALRIIGNAFTFDGGLDYVLHKLKSHSGVTIDVSPTQRKHPLLWSPVLGWKLYRKGAFK